MGMDASRCTIAGVGLVRRVAFAQVLQSRTSDVLPNPGLVHCAVQLGLPKALAQTGWTGILLMVLAGVVAIYTGKILVRSLYTKYVS